VYAFESHVLAELRTKLRRVAVPESLVARIEAAIARARVEGSDDPLGAY
jgi:hypothetical protein